MTQTRTPDTTVAPTDSLRTPRYYATWRLTERTAGLEQAIRAGLTPPLVVSHPGRVILEGVRQHAVAQTAGITTLKVIYVTGVIEAAEIIAQLRRDADLPRHIVDDGLLMETLQSELIYFRTRRGRMQVADAWGYSHGQFQRARELARGIIGATDREEYERVVDLVERARTGRIALSRAHQMMREPERQLRRNYTPYTTRTMVDGLVVAMEGLAHSAVLAEGIDLGVLSPEEAEDYGTRLRRARRAQANLITRLAARARETQNV